MTIIVIWNDHENELIEVVGPFKDDDDALSRIDELDRVYGKHRLIITELISV